MRYAEEKKSLCKKCSKVGFFLINGQKMLDGSRRRRESDPNYQKGINNPFFGKKHTAENIERMKHKDMSFTQTDSFKEKQRKNILSRKNPMNGKTHYEIWLKKYGKEEADKRQAIMTEKKRKNATGENNNMYGKPSPNGSGQGWKGWYKNIFFRSLRELFFIIDYIEANNWEWESGEMKKYKIVYQDNFGQFRNYFPDYVINGKIYEIKPKKLWNTPLVQAKIAGAKILGLEIILIDPPLNSEKIKTLYLNKEIKFLPKTEEKIKTYFNI